MTRVTSDGFKHAVKNEDGTDIHGVTKAVISVEAGRPARIDLTMIGEIVDVSGEAGFILAHPISGESLAVKRIEFANGTVFDASGVK